MTRRTLLALLLGAFIVGAAAVAAEREWQDGTWREYNVERPRVLFSTQTRDPNSNLPRTTAAREIRTYIIDTRTHRLELRQDATVDTPRIDVLVGEPVQLAIEKKNVYVKDGDGKEHKLSLRKQTRLEAESEK
ncbi:MAG: hypothetical protein EHM55_09545 [Acidobacteria bacterium]|nr:MAG: hypothetical protein EHM55_09545 [Acidobacteriota bacterium]